MKQIQYKENGIKFLIERTKKHMIEAFEKLENVDSARDCVDISIYLIDKVAEEVDAYFSENHKNQ